MRKRLAITALSFLGFFLAPALFFVASPSDSAVQMQVKRILLDPSTKSPVVILETLEEEKFIPIWIGKAEATSIAMKMEDVNIPRPNTHDLIRNILEGVGASLQRVTITDLRSNT